MSTGVGWQSYVAHIDVNDGPQALVHGDPVIVAY